MFKDYVRKLFYSFLSLVNCVLPKKKRVVVYAGDLLCDNSEAIYDYLVSRTNYDVILIANRYMDKFKCNHIIGNRFFPVIGVLLTSSVVLDSSLHQIKFKPNRKQLFIQMWHGMPLKKLTTQPSMLKNGDYYSRILSTSEVFNKSFEEYFRCGSEKMFLNGNPRSDYLNEGYDKDSMFSFDGIRLIWLPTYRNGLGLTATKSPLPVISEENICAFNDLLKKHNAIVYLKPHPLQTIPFFDNEQRLGLTNIRLITEDDLLKSNTKLYTLLGQCDALLTDYSSVYFDYLLLDRPIGFVIDDMDEYNENVGFSFDNPLEYMPGMLINNLESFDAFISNLSSGKDDYKEKRSRVNEEVNKHCDFNYCELIREMIAEYL